MLKFLFQSLALWNSAVVQLLCFFTTIIIISTLLGSICLPLPLVVLRVNTEIGIFISP